MTDAVETMAYAKSGGLPWHGLGNPVHDKMTTKEMLKAAGIDWTVSKREMFYKAKDGSFKPSTEDIALVRDKDDFHLTTVGVTWKPVQNEQAMDFFSKFVKAGKMQMETAGSLWYGRYIWCLARVNKDFGLGKAGNDQVRSYILLSSPHVHGKAMVIQFTPIRVVCWNTLNLALGSKLKGDGSGFRMPHSVEFNEGVKKQAELALGLAVEQMEEFKEVATLLSKKKATDKATEDYFCEVLKFDPKKMDPKSEREPLMLPKFRAALTHSPGAEMPSAMGTWWGNLNAVTHVVDHEIGRDRNTALKTAWFGGKAEMKRRALDIAIKRAA